jgi:hypothetical protein
MAAYLYPSSNGGLAFRKRVPIPLRDILGKLEIDCSLRLMTGMQLSRQPVFSAGREIIEIIPADRVQGGPND